MRCGRSSAGTRRWRSPTTPSRRLEEALLSLDEQADVSAALAPLAVTEAVPA